MAITFFVMDALANKKLPQVFDNVIDSGMFHFISNADRTGYVEVNPIWMAPFFPYNQPRMCPT
jgi:hypothetical protein